MATFYDNKRAGIVWAAVMCLGQTAGMAASRPLELKWTELGSMASGHKVAITLTEGGTVSGEAIAVRQDTLVLDVKNSSVPKTYPNGNAVLRRNEISLIKLERAGGSGGRTMGTVVGVLAGLGAGGYAAAHAGSGGAGVAILVGVGSVVAVVGHYAGRGLDRRVTLIRIVP